MAQSRVSATEVASQGSQQDSADLDLGCLIDERSPEVREADQYASWYDGVERTLWLLLQCVWIWTLHENVLRGFEHQKNIYHDALGRGQVHETLCQAKNFRNAWRKGSKKERNACFAVLDSIPSQKQIVEAGLMAAFRIPKLRCVFRGTDKMQQIRAHQLQLDKEREDLEREKKAFEESRSSRKMEVDTRLVDREKISQGIVARDRATLILERETFDEHVRSITADLDKRSAEIDEEKSSLQRALQNHRKLETEVSDLRLAHSTCALGDCKSAKGFESQFRIEHNRGMELQEKLDTKTAELKRLQDKEATINDDPNVSHEEICAILYRHQRSQRPQDLMTVTRKGTEDGSEDLAGMLRGLLTSHAREVNTAKIAKDRQRKLQEENEVLSNGSPTRRHKTRLIG